ncbi:MAG: bifunctional diaminohydroxyphosphoribosylaminopyrimidine deaminase/5-amino-6-(5-phosphoribosylamino)uracil reductase RibD [Verrucomicrobiia bacterium]|jgi:diaminohydroxyphosphoribosylaminopyrimidine deaminase/5-amino-6-(5-phosphoribosylamino)uracil reductase
MNYATPDEELMRLAIRLAKRAEGMTSPNPIVGAVLYKNGIIIGKGYHKRAGLPHAEIEAINNARKNGFSPEGSTLYVTLEPCSTYGRTPPCVDAIVKEKIREVVVGATDPNPKHSGRAFKMLESAGIIVKSGILKAECENLNEAFNHWIINKTPFVILKAAMTLDGKIATITGDSKWITNPISRKFGMQLRKRADAILVGVNTILADDPQLTYRNSNTIETRRTPRRIVLDSRARTPLTAKVVSDKFAKLTTIFVTENAPQEKIEALQKLCNVAIAPQINGQIDLNYVVRKLGEENVLSLLVEGGGDAHASFLKSKLAHRVIFFYAPKIICGRSAPRAVSGKGFSSFDEIPTLHSIKWRKCGSDLLLSALIKYP